ncbi:MAG: DNA gyrase subunit A [Ghiorsea sp.]
MADISVTEHVNNDLRDYAIYSLYERGIPNSIDGLKPSQRKAVYAANIVAKKPVKTVSLVGSVISLAEYHHGNLSMEETITKLAGEWNNNECILFGDGSFGSRLVPIAASPRYTMTGIHANFKKFFKDSDIAPSVDDDEHPEPIHYLPLIPWVLVNGVVGIATGFATKILPRSSSKLADTCISYLNSGNVDDWEIPYFNNFSGTVTKGLEQGQWNINGVITKKTSTKYSISEIPIGLSREKYIEILDVLVDKKTIVSYKDGCSRKGFEFEITIPRTATKTTIQQWMNKLKLVKKVTENLTAIDGTGNLRVYANTKEIIKEFCDCRLSFYDKRYKAWELRDKKKITILSTKIKFIKMIVDGIISFKDKNKATLRKELITLKFKQEDLNMLLDLPIYSLTMDNINKFNNEILELDIDVKKWQNTNRKSAYIKELKECK